MSIFMHLNPSTSVKLGATSRFLLDKWYGEREERERESARKSEGKKEGESKERARARRV